MVEYIIDFIKGLFMTFDDPTREVTVDDYEDPDMYSETCDGIQIADISVIQGV